MKEMKNDQFAIWITLECENPDMEDIAKAQCQLENLGVDYRGKVGIGFTQHQWGRFLNNLSRFEARFATGAPAQVMGFEVRMIEERK